MTMFEDRSPYRKSIHVAKSEYQYDGNVMALERFRNKMGTLKFADPSCHSSMHLNSDTLSPNQDLLLAFTVPKTGIFP